MPSGFGSNLSSNGAVEPAAASGAGDELHPDLQDPEQFAALYQQWFPRVVNFFLRRGFPRAEAEELANDVFFQAWEHREQYGRKGTVGAWIKRIAANLWKNELRDRGRIKRSVEEVELDEAVEHTASKPLFGSAEPSPEARAQGSEDVRRLAEAMNQLTPRQRTYLELRYGSELTYKEIAESLGVAVGTVQSQIHDGRKRLRELLGRDHDAPP